MRVTIPKAGRSQNYNAICWYAKRLSSCQETFAIQFGEETIELAINEPITVDGIFVTPITKGDPVSCADYASEPKIYRELILESDDENKLIEFMSTSVKEYEKRQKYFEKYLDKLLVLTWDGGSWSNEFKTPRRSNESIYLPDETYQKITTDLQKFYDQEARYKKLGIPYARTYMFHGIPGTGKTSTIYTIASEFNKNIAIIDFSNQNTCDCSIRESLYKLPGDTILCLEDIDSLFSSERKSDKSTITFSGVLNILDGVVQNTGLVIFMTTNLLKNMDDAAMKRRVDYYLKFDIMKKQQIMNMFSRFYPEQDEQKFMNRVSKLKLTPCILQKFFTRHLMDDNVLEHVSELVTMATEDYKVSEENSLYI
jgi:SpoVK/Ycf46/Vps4 family AAA+-type ATPase